MTVYAINKRTKEHHYFGHSTLAGVRNFIGGRLGSHDIVETDADGWIPWSGGECPLPDLSKADIKLRNKDVATNVLVTHDYLESDSPDIVANDWTHEGGPMDIVSYRPILSDDEGEQPEWSGEGLPPVGGECQLAMPFAGDMGAATITYVGDGVFCYRSHDNGEEYTGATHDFAFSPIRSDEDRAVEEMVSIAPSGYCLIKDVCRALYRAGYRKP